MYVPIDQDYQSNATIILRTNGDPAALAPELASAVHSLDPALPLSNVMTLRTHIAASYFMIKTPATVLSGFGLVALVLAGIGLYGLIAYSTMRRTREIGVRLALGAAPGQVRRMVIAQGARLAAIGVAVGLVAAVLLLRLLTSLLFGVRPFDPVTLLGTLFVVAAASLLASYVPAIRATRVDPLIALRSE